MLGGAPWNDNEGVGRETAESFSGLQIGCVHVVHKLCVFTAKPCDETSVTLDERVLIARAALRRDDGRTELSFNFIVH